MMRTAAPRPRRPAAQRGAALLTALVIVTVVTSVAAGMVWSQWKAVQVESAERARAQSYWLLTGALDWARLILREDMNASKGIDHLGEPWAVPLAEARLSTFLAADKNNTDLDGVEAFLSGRMEDLQARYNLRNLISDEGKALPQEVRTLERLCDLAKAPAGTAEAIVDGLLRALPAGAAQGASGPARADAGTLLPPRTLDDFVWFGLSPQTVQLLRPWVTLLQPYAGAGVTRTTVNLNTAPKEVIVAVLGVDQGSAQRLIQQRQSQPLKEEGELGGLLPQEPNGQNPPWKGRIGFASANFEVTGRLRYENQVIEERSMVVRLPPRNVKTWHRERINTVLGTPDPR